jgi:hypothetical protein
VAQRLRLGDGPLHKWVTMPEAARRLGISPGSFRSVAKEGGIEVCRRGRQPGVNWGDVERFIARSRITRVNETFLRQVDAGRPMPGVNLLDEIEARFGWSDHDLADALRVWPSVVSRYRVKRVPNIKIPALRRLAEMSPGEVDPPRRLVPKRGRSALPPLMRGPRRRRPLSADPGNPLPFRDGLIVRLVSASSARGGP